MSDPIASLSSSNIGSSMLTHLACPAWTATASPLKRVVVGQILHNSIIYPPSFIIIMVHQEKKRAKV